MWASVQFVLMSTCPSFFVNPTPPTFPSNIFGLRSVHLTRDARLVWIVYSSVMSRRREARDLERVLALSMRENESRNAVVEVPNQSVSPTSIAAGPVQETTGDFSPVPEHHARGNETMLLNHVVHTDPSQELSLIHI